MPVAVALRWLNEAANGGVRYQRFVETGNTRLAGNGVRAESYGAIEAALFRGQNCATMICQNAAANTYVWRLSPDLRLPTPASVERLAMPILTDPTIKVAHVENLVPSTEILISPYSVTRVVWNLR